MAEYMEYIKSIDWISNVYYNITKVCNFQCSYCYSTNSGESISFLNHLKIMEKLIELNVKSITLIGGEPLCHPDFYKILKHCLSFETIDEICVVTNGSLIDISRLQEFSTSKLRFQVSIDGTDEKSNSLTRGKNHFDGVFNNILRLKETGFRVHVMKVITRDNIESSKAYYNFFKRLGISSGFFW